MGNSSQSSQDSRMMITKEAYKHTEAWGHMVSVQGCLNSPSGLHCSSVDWQHHHNPLQKQKGRSEIIPALWKDLCIFENGTYFITLLQWLSTCPAFRTSWQITISAGHATEPSVVSLWWSFWDGDCYPWTCSLCMRTSVHLLRRRCEPMLADGCFFSHGP